MGSTLDVSVSPFAIEAEDYKSVDVSIHQAQELTVSDRLYPCVTWLEGTESFAARLFAGRDVVTFFTKDALQTAEALHALADALTDAHWHQQNEASREQEVSA